MASEKLVPEKIQNNGETKSALCRVLEKPTAQTHNSYLDWDSTGCWIFVVIILLISLTLMISIFHFLYQHAQKLPADQ